jgi:O-methyltransferase
MLIGILKDLLRRRLSTDNPMTATSEPAVEESTVTYSADGFATTHSADFLTDPAFASSYRQGADTGHNICAPADLHIEWRVYVCCWAAAHGTKLPGDFVECGVSTGITSKAVVEYVTFADVDKTLFLFDTFAGIPEGQANDAELALARSKNERHYFDCYEQVRATFAAYPNVQLVRGAVPDTLNQTNISSVAYLHIDMNIALPEVAASEYFWDRLVTGAIVVYDDYASLAHTAQKRALDDFAARHGVKILSLPTGQGLLIKP